MRGKHWRQVDCWRNRRQTWLTDMVVFVADTVYFIADTVVFVAYMVYFVAYTVDFVAGFGDKSATTWIRQLVAFEIVANSVDFVAKMSNVLLTLSRMCTGPKSTLLNSTLKPGTHSWEMWVKWLTQANLQNVCWTGCCLVSITVCC